MKVFCRLWVNCLFISSVACVAQAQNGIFNVDKAAGYHPVAPALKAYLLAQNASKGRQHICVIGYVGSISNGIWANKIAWVYWREGNHLTLWEPAAAGFKPKDTLKHARRDLAIEQDVSAKKGAVGSSTYKESMAWVEGIKKDCQKRGKSYEILMD